jgi:hypothetical protein
MGGGVLGKSGGGFKTLGGVQEFRQSSSVDTEKAQSLIGLFAENPRGFSRSKKEMSFPSG